MSPSNVTASLDAGTRGTSSVISFSLGVSGLVSSQLPGLPEPFGTGLRRLISPSVHGPNLPSFAMTRDLAEHHASEFGHYPLIF